MTATDISIQSNQCANDSAYWPARRGFVARWSAINVLKSRPFRSASARMYAVAPWPFARRQFGSRRLR